MAVDEPTIFVVDDDPVIVYALTVLLEANQMQVEAHGTAGDFLKAYHPSKQGCLLLDARLPEMSGIQLLDKLAEDEIQLPVIMFSGHADASTRAEAKKRGVVNFLEKPFPTEQLFASIHDALSAKS